MKKKILLVLVAFALFGCNGNQNNIQSSELSENQSSVNTSTENTSTEDNLSSTIVDETNYSQTTSIKVHYARNDNNFANWGIWTWQKMPNAGDGKMIMFNESDGIYGNVAVIDLVNDYTYVGATEIGFLIKTHDVSKPATQWTNGLSDISQDRFITVPEKSLNGVYEIYLYEGVSDIMTSLEQALKDKIVSADFTDKTTINVSVILSANVSEITKNMFHVYKDGTEIELDTFSYANKKITVTLKGETNITKKYTVEIDFPSGTLSMDVGISIFYDDPDFVNNFTYYGNDLGVTFNSDHTKTTFKLWAPISSKVVLNLYDTGTPSSYGTYTSQLSWSELTQDFPSRKIEMKKGQQGVWYVTLPVNLHGRYYTYSVTNGSTTNEVVDPYAKTCGIDGLRGQVIDFDQINEEMNWDDVNAPKVIEDPNDASIYEVHVRDVTIDETSGLPEYVEGQYNGVNVKKELRGNFLGLAQKGTTYTKGDVTIKTGLDNIKELGVTHIQLQPIFDYNSVDEAAETKYNWGYDPQNYNCLEGSYSTNPYDGLVRVKEFKTLMKTLCEENIAVNMDVVFNHTFASSDSNFEKIIPGYYHRMNNDGTFSNGSGCGNEMASERLMYRKFVVDSCKFWMSEYNISGFRFDLMALLDTTTMELVYKECKKINEDVLVYGEPWSGGTSTNTYIQTNQDTIQNIEGVAAFNDKFRDAMRGNNNLSSGWIQDSSKYSDSIIQGIYGQFTSSLINPTKTMNYVSCHDNYTLFDQIDLSVNTTLENKIKKVEQAQAMVFMAEGIPFIHGGEEFLRTKQNGTGNQVHNSYNAGDEVNKFDYSRKVDYLDTFNFTKEIIKIRNEFKGFRLTTYDDIVNAIVVNSQSSCIDYTITYNNETYRVISNSGSSYLASGLDGYNLLVSNKGSNLSGNTMTLSQNEICVLKK